MQTTEFSGLRCGVGKHTGNTHANPGRSRAGRLSPQQHTLEELLKPGQFALCFRPPTQQGREPEKQRNSLGQEADLRDVLFQMLDP